MSRKSGKVQVSMSESGKGKGGKVASATVSKDTKVGDTCKVGDTKYTVTKVHDK